ATALVVQHDAIPLRIKKPGERAVAARTRSAVHDDDRLAGERAVFFPVDPMLRKSRCGQMAGPDKRWIRRSVSAGVVWRDRLGDFIHGDDFCDKWEQVA